MLSWLSICRNSRCKQCNSSLKISSISLETCEIFSWCNAIISNSAIFLPIFNFTLITGHNIMASVWTLFWMDIFGVVHWCRQEGPKRPCFPKIFHTFFNHETWHSYTLPKEDSKKYINHVTRLFEFCWHQIIFTEI